MKRKATALFLGICMTFSVFAASPADARSTTGFSAFHVEVQGTLGTDPYTCLGEAFGAVVNNCGYSVSLEFDLPIDNTGGKTITVQDYWGPFGTPNAPASFTCQVYSYAGTSNFSYVYGGAITFVQPGQQLAVNLDVPSNGMSIQLICWNVPPGGGIANINWNA
jgi:hypothetical protein